MPRRRRQPPLELQDPKIDSAAAADRGVPPPMVGAAASTPQAHHLPRFPSFTAPRTPQRHDRCSIPPAAAAAPSPARALHQSRATCPAATSTTSSRPQRRAVGTARGPLNPRQQADAAKSPSSVAALKTTPPSLQVVLNSTYAEAVKGRAKASESPDDNLVHRLFHYLINFAIISDMTANHNNKGPIITVRDTGNSDLRIVEEHLDKHDLELSYAVFNCQHRFKEWLYPTVYQFLISKGIVNNAVRGMNATFYTMPPSTKTLEDFVQEQGSLVSIKSIFDGNFELCVASDIGMMLVHGFLVYILNIHKQGRTWNGEFSIGDMMVENCFKCRITKVSMQGESRCRAADLHKIAEIFKPMLTINEEMALYFDVLQKDLCATNNVKVEAKWYREYLLSHPALKPSIARYNLECGLHHVMASFKFKDKPVRSILGECIQWQALITKGTVLYEVFWYKHDPTEGLHPYAPTVGGLLTYKRNFLQHGHEHVKVQDHTELEQFAAKTFPQALPNILQELLSHCKMNGPFKDHWEAYHSSIIGNGGNTEGRTGIRISFCEDVRARGKM